MIRPKLRINDVCLMDVAFSKNFTKIQLERINAVREHFNLQYLSEICNVDGTQLATGIMYDFKVDRIYFRRHKLQNKRNQTVVVGNSGETF